MHDRLKAMKDGYDSIGLAQEETPLEELRLRCKDKWPSQSEIDAARKFAHFQWASYASLDSMLYGESSGLRSNQQGTEHHLHLLEWICAAETLIRDALERECKKREPPGDEEKR
jgi:hypothetical protein